MSKAEIQALNSLVNNEMIEKFGEEGEYRITERGNVHVKALLSLDLPSKSWVSPGTFAKK